ncbi:MAG: glutaminase [Bacteroidota bacterium]
MNYSEILAEIHHEITPLFGQGKVADYIPALAKMDPNKFGMAITTIDGELFTFGNTKDEFTIQSISKVFTFVKAFSGIGEKIWEHVGREPSGTSFNSLVQLEHEFGIPRNPFINAGALVITDLLISEYGDAKKEILNFLQDLSQDRSVRFDLEVAESEKQHGFRNAALANFMKSFGNIENDIESILDTYFYHCSILMNCEELAKSFLFLANNGIIPGSNKQLLTKSQAKRTNALMLSCGLYDESGEFAFRVGLPGKSGVGGAIAAIIPNKMAISVWSPELDEYGNSLIGIKALELFTTKTGMSIF